MSKNHKVWKVFFLLQRHNFFLQQVGVELLQEGELELGADLISLLLLLLEVLLQLVRGETHFGVAAFVRSAMRSQPGTLQTLGCGGPAPVRVSHRIHKHCSPSYTQNCGGALNDWTGRILTRICCWGCSSWSSRLPLTGRGNNVQTGSSLSWCCGLAPSRARPGRGCQHSAWRKTRMQVLM